MFHYVFNAETEFMLPEEYIAELETFIRFVKQYEPKKVLGDMIDFKFTISPTIQEWVNQNLFSVYIKIGFEKIAIILAKELFPQVSVQQTMEEETTHAFQTQYFEDAESALAWLEA